MHVPDQPSSDAEATHPGQWRARIELREGRRTSADEFGESGLTDPGLDRRGFMKLATASIAVAAAASGCRRATPEFIVPFTHDQARFSPGTPQYFATTLTRAGVGIGVIARSNDGRPTKVEGNPRHPSSLGATDAVTQAEIFSLYDPRRSRAARRLGEIAPWEAFDDELGRRIDRLRPSGGEGLHIVVPGLTSPTIGARIALIRDKLPAVRWYRHEVLDDGATREGVRLTVGERFDQVYRFDRARAVVLLDADPLAQGAASCRYARDVMSARRGGGDWRGCTVLAAEPTPSVSGARADLRLAARAGDIPLIAQELAGRLLNAPGPTVELRPGVSEWIEVASARLREAGSAALVMAGPAQPPSVHALALAMNIRLGALGSTVGLIEPLDVTAAFAAGLESLAGELESGTVDTLLLLDVNPVYQSAPELRLAERLQRARFSATLGLHESETSSRCTWQLPMLHELESWGDARAHDGTASVTQPLLEPLYAGRSVLRVLGVCLGDSRPDYDIVRAGWSAQADPPGFEDWWINALTLGIVPGSERPWITPAAPPSEPAFTSLAPDVEGVEVAIRPDPTILDGRYAGNEWLQELPKPCSTLTWENALLLAPADAAQLRVEDGDIVLIDGPAGGVEVPVLVMPGQAEGSAALTLGYSQLLARRAGAAGGADAFALRTVKSPWRWLPGRITPTGHRRELSLTQLHSRMEGRDPIRVRGESDQAEASKPGEPAPVHLPLYEPAPAAARWQWGMSIDLAACIGCGACTAACQAENNIPTVGREEVLRGREMHWIRVDRYFQGPLRAPRILHQPVPCMHCEAAPCELVCPVGATLHSDDGLNEMTYNRCIGTRYCSNNCPYKVRRFNFFRYSDIAEPQRQLMRNPRVTTRARGVMEKCTYCVQRIRAAEMEARASRRPLARDQVRTACQQVCPTSAIVFGDVNDPGSTVAAAKRDPRAYALLAELNTRPRTTYLEDVRLEPGRSGRP